MNDANNQAATPADSAAPDSSQSLIKEQAREIRRLRQAQAQDAYFVIGIIAVAFFATAFHTFG